MKGRHRSGSGGMQRTSTLAAAGADVKGGMMFRLHCCCCCFCICVILEAINQSSGYYCD